MRMGKKVKKINKSNNKKKHDKRNRTEIEISLQTIYKNVSSLFLLLLLLLLDFSVTVIDQRTKAKKKVILKSQLSVRLGPVSRDRECNKAVIDSWT